MTDDYDADEREQGRGEDRRRHRDDPEDGADQDTTQGRPKPSAEDTADGDEGAEVIALRTEIRVPTIDLEEESVRTSSVSVDSSLPAVSVEEDRALQVPKVGLEEIDVAWSAADFVTAVPTIRKEKQAWKVPIVVPQSEPSVVFRPRSLAVEIPDRPEQRRQRVQVPLFRKGPTPEIRFLLELDTTVDAELRRRLVEGEEMSPDQGTEAIEQEELEEEVVSPVTATGEPSVSTGRGGVVGEEMPDPFELLFTGGGDISMDDPLVIGLDDREDRYMGALRTLCQRLYREKRGGNPDPLILRDLGELVGERGSSGEVRWMEAEDQIFSIQLDEEEWETLITDEQQEWERIWNRVDQLFAQGFGVILLNKLLQRLPTEKEHLIQNIRLTPRRLSPEVQRDVASLCWGFVEVEEAHDFNMVFEYAQHQYQQRLREQGTAEGGIFQDATNEHSGDESDEHRWIKWFVVRYLVEQLREQGVTLESPMEIEQTIQTEEPVSGGDEQLEPRPERHSVVADVKRGNEVFEVETLFGQGRDGSPRNKLQNSFLKYEGTDIDTVHIVMENLTFYRHLTDIIQLKRNRADWEERHNIKIRFETLDLKQGELIGYQESHNRLTNLIDSIDRLA